MKFEQFNIQGKEMDLSILDHFMEDIGFVRAGQWDYERVTYDYKFEILKDVYYLRVQGYAIKGDVDTKHAVIKLLTPILGKHYYPHGVEYGPDEKFPKQVLSQSETLLKKVETQLQAFTKVPTSK
ncbi:MAG: YugN family protein [Bacillaceae bacterium]